MKRVFVLGLDGATLDLLNRPVYPTIKKMIDQGWHGRLFSRPALTPVAWPSITSGVNAGKHGIFDFRKGERLYSSLDKRRPEVWDYLRSVVINVPMSYPVRQDLLIMIGDMMSPDFSAKSVYPEGEIEFLRSLDYCFEPEVGLESIERSIRARIKVVRRYLDLGWELFFVVFREFDVIQHFFWGQETKFYGLIDEFVSEILIRHDIDDFLIISDHGFLPVNKGFNLENFLKEIGLMVSVKVTGWGALKIAEGLERESLRGRLISELSEVEFLGEKILDIFPKEEIFSGGALIDAPDLIVFPKRELGFTLSMVGDEVIIQKIEKTGCHSEWGIFVGFGKDFPKPKEIEGTIYDIMPTILKMTEKEVPDGLDGGSLC